MTRLLAPLLALLCLAFAPAALADDVTVELRQFGVGSHVRPGERTGILVRLTSNLTQPVNARVQWELHNADGDTALYARDVPLAPGAPTERWLYGVLPIISASAQDSLEEVTVVRVLELEEGAVTRQLAVARLNGRSAEDPPTAVQVEMDLFGVLGDGRAGLGPFSPTAGSGPGQQDVVPSMNSATLIARNMATERLPDRWEGLSSYAVLVWGNATTQNLGTEQARALLDWVRRGGDLVILLPDSGDPWGLLNGKGGRTPLADVLPEGGVARHDSVLVSELMPLISRVPGLKNPNARTALWTFDTKLVGRGYESVMAMPTAVDNRTGVLMPREGTLDGQTVAVRRNLGFGTIAVVGIDADGLDRRSLLGAEEGLPQADIFWNRFVARRADAPSGADWTKIANAQRVNEAQQVDVDGGKLFSSFIGMRGSAAIGVFGLIVAFGIYWLAAGPGIFYALRMVRKPQFAWLGFVLVAAAATTITWMATGVNELSAGRIQHVTYLDHVVDPRATAQDRAVINVHSWFSAELPGYGPTRVSLGKGSGTAGDDAYWTWFVPPSGRNESFPDQERYTVNLSGQSDYDMPSRATSTELCATWIGDPTPSWTGLPQVMDGSALQQSVTWKDDGNVEVSLQGSLMHTLPAELEDVQIIHITPMRSQQRTMTLSDPLRMTPESALPNIGAITALTVWKPNQALDLSEALYKSRESLTAGFDKLYNYRELHGEEYYNYQYGYGQRELKSSTQFALLNYYNMLPQPKYLLSPSDAGKQRQVAASMQTLRIVRDMARSVDLSMWFTRPCLIVIGTLKDRSWNEIGAPIPMQIAGRDPGISGETVVRVIFPLPDDPALIAPRLETAEQKAVREAAAAAAKNVKKRPTPALKPGGEDEPTGDEPDDSDK